MQEEDAASSLRSHARSYPHIHIVEVSVEHLVKHLVAGVNKSLQPVVQRVTEVAIAVSGGCAFAIAAKQSFVSLQDTLRVDFQVVDKSKRWPDGYMTTKFGKTHVSDPKFLEALQEFSARTENDRWPEEHEAGGLPKDGFAALVAVYSILLRETLQ